MIKNCNLLAFFALVQSGLWEKNVELRDFGTIDFSEVYRLAEEQSVIGLVAAGLEHITDVKVPQMIALQFAGAAMQIENRNNALNQFTVAFMKELRNAGVDSVLIKGQGVGQCYERPHWRASGDVDLLLNDENYEKGKAYLDMIAKNSAKEYDFNKEYNTTINGWCVELHGSLRCGLSSALNKCVDAVQQDICDNHNVRYWYFDDIKIPLPEPNDDALLIFTHYIKHFYKGGLGIRQICDWCRLLYCFRSELDLRMLESRIGQIGMMEQWKGFGAFAVDYLGMPVEAMPFYSSDRKWSKKANRICSFMLEVGNFGHNVDSSYYSRYPLLVRKAISMGRLIKTLLRHSTIFPLHSFYFMPHVIFTGVKATIENGTGYKN